MQPADIDRKDRRRLAKSLAVTAFFYFTLFSVLLTFGALIPGGGAFQARKGSTISLRLDAESGAKRGHGTGAEGKNGAPEPSARTVKPAPKTTAGAAPSEAVDRSLPGPTQETSNVDGTGTAGETQNAYENAAGSGDGTGGSSFVDGTVGGTPAFISWLDSAIRSKLSYPEKARKRNIEGTVTILAEVSADGKNCIASVGQSSGSSILDSAAVAFVKSLFPSPVSPRKTFSGTLRIQYILKREGT